MLAGFSEARVARQDIAAALRVPPAGNRVVLYRLAGPRGEIVRVIHGAREATALL